MSNQTVTLGQVIEMSIMDLRAINVPVGMVMEIGVPIAKVLHNLEVCMKTIEKDNQMKAQQASDDGPVIKVVETGVSDEIPEGAEPIQPIEGGEAYAEEDQLESQI